jgi:hypothetical protein
MNLNEAARALEISPRTLRLAVERGDIQAAHPLPDGPWVFQRQAIETPAAAALVARVRDRNHPPAIPSPVEHATQAHAVHGAAVYAEAHDTTRALVQDHQHPVRAQDRRFAPKQVDAP